MSASGRSRTLSPRPGVYFSTAWKRGDRLLQGVNPVDGGARSCNARRMRGSLPFALLVLFSAPLGAETYKWVDAKGVVNYSNAPPPESAAIRSKVIEERVSTVPTDPALLQIVAAMRARALRRIETEDMEWLERQRILAARFAAPTAVEPACPYRANCLTPYGAPYAAYAYYPAVYRPAFTAMGFRQPAPMLQRPAFTSWRGSRAGRSSR